MTNRDKLILALRMYFRRASSMSQSEMTMAILSNTAIYRYWLECYGTMSPSGMPRRVWLKLESDVARSNEHGHKARVGNGNSMHRQPKKACVKVDKRTLIALALANIQHGGV